MEIWQKLNTAEYDKVWDEFENKFNFKPSPKEEKWPSINEPTPSKTWSISGYYDLDDSESEDKQDELCVLTASAFKKVSSDDWIYALDWQHTCYKVYLNAQLLESKSSEWRIPIIPDGDYSIFLTSDLKCGVFAHPWEETICVFGKEFLETVEQFFDESLFAFIRSK